MCPSIRVFLVFWAFFLPEDWGYFQASVGGCHCLPLPHCLSDLPRVETLLSDHARRLGELSNFNVKVAIPPGIPGVSHPGKADDRCIKHSLSSNKNIWNGNTCSGRLCKGLIKDLGFLRLFYTRTLYLFRN